MFEKFKKKYLTPGVFLLIGIILILVSVILKIMQIQILPEIFSTIGTTLMVASTVGYSIDYKFKNSLIELLKRDSCICSLSNKIGLEKILYSDEYDYKDFIENDNEITIVMNDGKRWISNNYIYLEERFKRKKPTNFIFLEPDCEALKLVAEKTRKNGESIQDKIEKINRKIDDSVRELKSINGEYKELKIYYSKNYNVQSIYLSEKRAIITTYRTSNGIKKTRVPMMIFSKNNYFGCDEYSNIDRDVKYLIKESNEIV